ncbi:MULTISPECIES: hypothetical protein [unclassified Clostridium]|nr:MULTISPECIES: hypothetical protein [unclassified Clostridium]
MPKAKASGQRGDNFTADVGSDGTVTVKAGTVEIFPVASSPYNLS